MKLTKIAIAAGTWSLMMACVPANAGTLSGGSSMPNIVTVTTPNEVVTIKHTVGIFIWHNEKVGCGAKISYDNGSPSETFAVPLAMAEATRYQKYSTSGEHMATVIGVPYLGLPACRGLATAHVNIKVKPKLGLPPMLTTITAFETPTDWQITVHGIGDKLCKYHVRLWSLPEMSILKDQAMTYQKGIFGNHGKGLMTIPKPQPGKSVRVTATADIDDKIDNMGCIGSPKLDLHVAAAPVPFKKFGQQTSDKVITPQKGLITLNLNSNKTIFALGEPILATIKVQGDSCYFNWKARKLSPPGTPDVPLVGKADPLKANQWELSNLGMTLTVGDYQVLIQSVPSNALAAGEVSCDIAPDSNSYRVLFTVVP